MILLYLSNVLYLFLNEKEGITMTIVKAGFRDGRLELIAKDSTQWNRMEKMYSKVIDGHEIIFKVVAMYFDNKSDYFFFALLEDISWIKKTFRKFDFSLKDLVGTQIDEYYEPENPSNDDNDDGLGAFSPDYHGW